jgi:hypothetical protein
LTGGNEPGEVDGHPVPALLVRHLAYALGLLPRPAEVGTARPEAQHQAAEAEEAEPVEPDGQAAEADEDEADGDEADGDEADGDEADGDAAEASSAPLADVLNLRSAAGTALTDIPTVAVVDEISGQLLALASPREIRRAATCGRLACRTGRTPCTHPPTGPGLGPPPDSPVYRPTEALQRFTHARDRRCRFPGCRVRAERCDLDHNTPWPAGATSCQNLCCLCRHHHRLSHQAPGWRMRRLPDGGLEWTSPSGDRVTTHPIPYGTDDAAPPPTQADPCPPPLTLRERVLGRPPTPEERATDPAPF